VPTDGRSYTIGFFATEERNMPATFAQGGIQFMYPDNWELAGQSLDTSPQVVELQSPASAFWTLHVYPIDSDAGEIIDEFRDAMQAEYDSLEAEPVEETEGDEPVLGYDMTFYCLDFVITAKVRCWRVGNSLVLTHAQAEDREFADAAPIFRAMTVSLMRDSKL
jgi:hypothetical protein